SAPQHPWPVTSRTSWPFTARVRMVASWTWEKRPCWTQPLNSRAVEVGEARWRVVEVTPLTGFVAASIPIEKPNLPEPASSRGIPVSLSRRANQYTTLLTPDVVSAHNARRANTGSPRVVEIRERAASSPCPYRTPEGHTGSQARQ